MIKKRGRNYKGRISKSQCLKGRVVTRNIQASKNEQKHFCQQFYPNRNSTKRSFVHHIFILGQTDPIINPESSPLINLMSYKKNKL